MRSKRAPVRPHSDAYASLGLPYLCPLRLAPAGSGQLERVDASQERWLRPRRCALRDAPHPAFAKPRPHEHVARAGSATPSSSSSVQQSPRKAPPRRRSARLFGCGCCTTTTTTTPTDTARTQSHEELERATSYCRTKQSGKLDRRPRCRLVPFPSSRCSTPPADLLTWQDTPSRGTCPPGRASASSRNNPEPSSPIRPSRNLPRRQPPQRL